MDAVKAIFDGYDVGVRYADDALGILMNKLDDLGVLDETAVLISTDHGEAFGELGVYADHQAADEATCHIPAVLRWPGVAPRVHAGLQYHLDVAATVLDLAGFRVPRSWDGVPIDLGRMHRDGSTSCCHRARGHASEASDSVITSTSAPGTTATTGIGPTRCCSMSARDPHETIDLWDERGHLSRTGASLLEDWTAAQLDRTGLDDPMDVVRAEGGPFHVRGHLGPYVERLRATGRGGWARVLEERHADEL